MSLTGSLRFDSVALLALFVGAINRQAAAISRAPSIETGDILPALLNDNTMGSLLAAVYMAAMPTSKRGATGRRINLAVSALCVGWVVGGFIDAVLTHYVPAISKMQGRALAVSFACAVFLPKTVALLYDKAPQAIVERIMGAIQSAGAKSSTKPHSTPTEEGEEPS